MIEPTYNDIKVYQINVDFYEFKEIKNDLEAIIDCIIGYHKKHFETEFEVRYSEDNFVNSIYNYRLYTFNELEKESIWKDFFPKELVKDKDFTVKSTSFVLFVQTEERLFCTIGGKGISVIKRFINNSFGLDLYEKIADPVNDIVYSQISRGVSGNLTSEQKTYRNEQRLQEALAIGRVPQKLYLRLRDETRDTFFDFIDFDKTENIYLEIGSSFCLKWKILFNQLNDFIIRLNEILNISNSKPLSRFDRIRDENFINSNLQPALLNDIRDDMVRLSLPNSSYGMFLDNDFVHPSKLNLFYECDIYKAYLKDQQNPFLETRDRTAIYSLVLKYVKLWTDFPLPI